MSLYALKSKYNCKVKQTAPSQAQATEIPPACAARIISHSFFTFQTMSYSIDLYKRKVKLEKNYFTYLTYVSMFPQLIAGPIIRFSVVMEELQ